MTLLLHSVDHEPQSDSLLYFVSTLIIYLIQVVFTVYSTYKLHCVVGNR